MSNRAKLILSWDIKQETESDYFEFMVSEFIPAINKLGIHDVQAWYTLYGNCEQILFSGLADDPTKMGFILASETWETLRVRLEDLVENFNQKVIGDASGRFQL
jgi:hypothetical protein